MPLSPTATRELLQKLRHFPKRSLGQNFLVDANIVHKSVSLAEVDSTDDVVEVGPGLGTLTEALLATGARVWAVEQDAKLAAHLATTMGLLYDTRFNLLEGDALKIPLAGYEATQPTANFKIVANLPYAISTPWMDRVLHGPLPQRMVLMLQLEAAQRYTAKVGSKQFGPISIILQSAFDIAPGHKVPSACFHPRPDVDSYLIHLVRKPQPFRFDPAVHQLIRDCFQQRRKQVGSLLRTRHPDGGRQWISELQVEGIKSNARPEQIPVNLWQKLTIA